jgi:hypothetical protein
MQEERERLLAFSERSRLPLWIWRVVEFFIGLEELDCFRSLRST